MKFCRVGDSFLHAVDPGDITAVHNLCWIGKLVSAEMSSASARGTGVRDTTIEDLANTLPQGTMSPRAASFLWIAALQRMGRKTGIGVPPYKTYWHDEADSARILEISDAEIAFERVRRSVAPDAPSRLSGIYLAEDSKVGQEGLLRMFPNRRQIRVMLIACERSHWGDPLFFDEHVATKAPPDTLARDYWSSAPHASHRMWECLIDGAVVLHPSEDRDALKGFAGSQAVAYRAWQESRRQDAP